MQRPEGGPAALAENSLALTPVGLERREVEWKERPQAGGADQEGSRAQLGAAFGSQFSKMVQGKCPA